jgi:chitin disaccharide deacetylase
MGRTEGIRGPYRASAVQLATALARMVHAAVRARQNRVMDRTVVLHVDDVGMCHGANVAFVELSRLGTVTSGSVMVPCPWFPEAAELAAADTTLDLGVHLTLTSEKVHYRWGPLTRPSSSAGLTDPDGYLWRDVSSVRRHAHPDAVEAELRAQLDRALAGGIDVTHLDAHMGATLAPEFCAAYIRIATDYRLPLLMTRTITGFAPNNHLVGVDDAVHQPFATAATSKGQQLFETVLETNWSRTAPARPFYEGLIGGVPDGLTFVCLHPNAPGELEFIEPDSSYIRTDEYDLFRTETWVAWLAEQPVTLSGMRPFRRRLRSGL